MVDLQTVCCLCGDIGFPDKLFRCSKCHHRFQHSKIGHLHKTNTPPRLPPAPPPQPSLETVSLNNPTSISYCSNYYSESSEAMEQCDWCQSEERSLRSSGSSKKSLTRSDSGGATKRSQYSGDNKIKQLDSEDSTEKGKQHKSGAPSPRPTTRRYKLLKDVKC